MNEKDPIEELFRREAEETLFQDKPREVVWQKIESNLQTKTQAPIKNFIQSVWFSAAVFALIAVPYFYFFLENMNNRKGNIEIVKQSVEKILSPEIENKEAEVELETIVFEAPIIVKNENKVVLKDKKEENLIVRNKQIDTNIETQNNDLAPDNSNKPIAIEAKIDTILLVKADSPKMSSTMASAPIDTILLAANNNAAAKESIALRAKSAPQENSPLSFQRNRFIIQDKVTRVSFEFIRKNNNRLIFQKEGIKLTLVRDQGQVKILTNTNNIKPEILSQIQSNKELIYNYYINFDSSKNR
ncbi:hypothetical protein [Faecalibacter macacae]|uniref:Uncharacterized protein n=1 Tax=Faecalibacter macacae TaxID=1859289 RepID=A0A3L9M1X1_9FLAO|nr:hypothetical protein [Faecalibacter macacae]RLZ06862.1 hypothetical protein EAH69_12305 [Faecalibacter macacae]